MRYIIRCFVIFTAANLAYQIEHGGPLDIFGDVAAIFVFVALWDWGKDGEKEL